MTTEFFQQLAPNWNPGRNEPFRAVARYNSLMDHLLYLKEDCPYRADRVDKWLTLLWHPYHWELVGIKLKGIRAVFRELMVESSSEQDPDVLPIAELLGEILMAGGAARLMDSYEEERKLRLRQKYRLALRFATKTQAAVPSEELRRAA
jgi:hypothetical protein